MTASFQKSLTFLAAVALLALPARTVHAQPITDVSELNEVDLSGLSDAQKKTALKVMNENPCNCGCQLTIATCRVKDSSCRRSLIFARTIVDALREGRSEADVVRRLKAKADTFVEVALPDDADVVYDIDLTQNPVRGPKDAPVAIVEFSDFQCPFCASIQDALGQVLKAFPKDVRLVFKQFPLNIHQHANMAALASLAAHGQGKFWEMHDKLFANFSAIDEDNITRWAREIGLNMTDFEKALQTAQHDAIVRKDMADGAAAKVLGTPTLFVNGRRVHDRSFEGLKKLIQQELASSRAASPPRK